MSIIISINLSIMIQSFHDAELSATLLRHKRGQINVCTTSGFGGIYNVFFIYDDIMKPS